MPYSISSETLNSTLAIIMGGGRGSRLYPLTKDRSKPAVPLAGKYRLVDIPISNCINSGISGIYVLTQFNSESLNRHINDAYKFDSFGRDFVRVLAAQQTDHSGEWYQGTADAVRQNISYFLEQPYEYFIILSGDQLYRMDYRKMLRWHIEHDADVTIATTPVNRDDAKGFGIMQSEADGAITNFVEKPQEDAELDPLVMPKSLLSAFNISGEAERFQASMGIYIFNRKMLEACLDCKETDFGGEIIPQIIQDKKRVFSYVFTQYWEDIGTIKSFHAANIDLTKTVPSYNFFDTDNTIYTRARFLPASKVNNAVIDQALLSDGCIITNAVIRNSIIGVRSVIESGCNITDSVIMGSDFYNKVDFDENGKTRSEPIRIGTNTRIHKAIVDKNAQIGANVTIDPGDRENEDTPYCLIRDGIAVVPKNMVIPDGVRV